MEEAESARERGKEKTDRLGYAACLGPLSYHFPVV